MLKKLILSIIGNQIDKALIKNIDIIVVDNDIERTAEAITNELKTIHADRFTIIYHSYPKKGLSYVRNEIFRKALECSPDYILCIDDDEYATTEWIIQLLLTITKNKCDIAMGPVIPEIEFPVSSAISYWFKSPRIMNDQELNKFDSGNFIICTKFLVKNNLEFDPRFNLTGAEDSYFGVMALKMGAKIYRAGGAIAYETISENRASLNWLIKRFYRGALTYSHILILEKKYLKIIKKLFVNVINIIAGIISLILLPFQSKYRYWGILKISESAGSFAGMAGIKYHEYKEDNKS